MANVGLLNWNLNEECDGNLGIYDRAYVKNRSF